MQHKGLIFGIFGGIFGLAIVITVFLSVGPGRSSDSTSTPQPEHGQQVTDTQLEARIRQLIAELGSGDRMQRQRAQTELVKIGAPALPLLRETARSRTNFWLASRAARLYRAINAQVNPPIHTQVELPKPPADVSLNLLDSFGVKLGESDEGFRVVDVKKNSRAARALLQGGDLIISIGGRQMNSLSAVEEAITKAAADKPLIIEVERRGEPVTLTAPPN